MSVKRNTGVSSSQNYELRYQYRGSGTVSNLGKGLVGFPTIRIEDPQTGTVTYKKHELDKSGHGPEGLVGDMSAVLVYSGIYGQAGSQLLSRKEWRYGVKTLNHSNGASTYLPVIEQDSAFSYENGTFLGGTIKTNNYVLDNSNNLLARIESQTKTGSKLQTVSFTPQYYGHNAPYAFETSRVKNENTSTTHLGNTTSGSDWRIGYTTSEVHTEYNGASGTSYVTDSKTRTINYTVKAGTTKVETETHYPGDLQYERQLTYSYDSKGRTASITESGKNIETRVTQFQQYQNSTPTLTINPLGHRQTIEELDGRYELPTRRVNENGLTQINEYDAFGRLTLSIDEDGVATTTRYASCGCSSVPGKFGAVSPVYYVEVFSPITPTSRKYYDSLNRVIRTQVKGFDGQWINTDTQYDEFGRLYRTSLPYISGQTAYYSTHSYDNTFGRLTRIDQADGGYTTSVYDAVAESGEHRLRIKSTKYIVDSNGAAEANVRTDSYMDINRLDRVVNAVGTGEETTTKYSYDAMGNTSQVEVDGGTDGTTVSTSTYDHAGNRISMTDPNTGAVTSTYTALNELRSQTDAAGNLTQYKYDKLGRLKERTDAQGTNNWYYDPTNAKGMIDLITNTQGFRQQYHYAYARLERLETTISIPGLATQNFSETYTRDFFGRNEETTWPSGFYARNEYNDHGYLKAQWFNYPIVMIDRQGPFGIEKYRTLANETNEKTFDPKSGRVSTLKTWQGSSQYQNKSYRWHSNGSMETFTDHLANVQDSHTYDSHDRLTNTVTKLASSGTVQRNQTWQYNNLGNLEAKTSSRSGDLQATSYQYGTVTNAGPHAASSVNINGSATQLSYDANGAVTGFNASGTSQDKYLSYNAANQPLVINSGATSINDNNYKAREEYRYSPNGEWYYKKSSYRENGALYTAHTYRVGNYETTLYLPQGPGSSVIKSEKTRVGSFLHVKNTDSVGNVTVKKQYLHLDHLGSVVGVRTAGASSNLSSMAYEAFGSRRSANLLSNASASEIAAIVSKQPHIPGQGFTGHNMLDRIGFIHMEGRIYDPRIGRFLSPDPIVQAPNNSQSWNRYSYVFNNPLKYTDPSGYSAEDVPIEEVVVTGPQCGACQRDNFPGSFKDWFFHNFGALDRSSVVWKTFNGVMFNTGSLEGSILYSIATAINANNAMMLKALGNGSKTNTNNIYSALAHTGRSTQEGSFASYFGERLMSGQVRDDMFATLDMTLATGESAAQHWADIAVHSDHPLATLANVPGVFASLWTRDTAGTTFLTLATAGTFGVGYAKGIEFTYKGSKNFRIAFFGNRTGHATGKFPHYHRRVRMPNGQTKPGQSIRRHRPWDKKETDKSFWDRF